MDIYRHGHAKTSAIFVKMVAWLPRRASQLAEGALIVRSTPDAILQAFNIKDEVMWTYHGDQLRRRVAEHRKKLQHLADDEKAELRPVPPFARFRRLAVDRFHRRMDSATHEIAAMLVGYAQRRKFAAVQYSDADQSFGEGLPWAELRRKVADKQTLLESLSHSRAARQRPKSSHGTRTSLGFCTFMRRL